MKTLKQTDELHQYLQQVSLPREVSDSLAFSMQLVEQCNAGKSYADKISSIRIMDECEGYGDLLKCATLESDEVILTDNGAWLHSTFLFGDGGDGAICYRPIKTRPTK